MTDKKPMLFYLVIHNQEQKSYLLHQEIGYKLNEVTDHLFVHLKHNFPMIGDWKIMTSGSVDVEKMLGDFKVAHQILSETPAPLQFLIAEPELSEKSDLMKEIVDSFNIELFEEKKNIFTASEMAYLKDKLGL